MAGLLAPFLKRVSAQPYDERMPPILGGDMNLGIENGRMQRDFQQMEQQRQQGSFWSEDTPASRQMHGIYPGYRTDFMPPEYEPRQRLQPETIQDIAAGHSTPSELDVINRLTTGQPLPPPRTITLPSWTPEEEEEMMRRLGL